MYILEGRLVDYLCIFNLATEHHSFLYLFIDGGFVSYQIKFWVTSLIKEFLDIKSQLCLKKINQIRTKLQNSMYTTHE